MFYTNIKEALRDSFRQIFTCYKDEETGYEMWLLNGEIVDEFHR